MKVLTSEKKIATLGRLESLPIGTRCVNDVTHCYFSCLSKTELELEDAAVTMITEVEPEDASMASNEPRRTSTCAHEHDATCFCPFRFGLSQVHDDLHCSRESIA